MIIDLSTETKVAGVMASIQGSIVMNGGNTDVIHGLELAKKSVEIWFKKEVEQLKELEDKV